MTTKTILIATNNIGKLKEIVSIIGDLNFEFKSLHDIGYIEEIDEIGKTFRENAVIKAQEVGEKTGMLVLAEDSGLEVDALGGRPGIYSARYCEGSDLDRIKKLLNELKDIPQEKRTARFVAVVALYDPERDKTYTFEGESKGRITFTPSGKNGFGYDPVFYNFDLGKTNGQATMDEKNRVSHRARALIKAKRMLSVISSQ